MEEDQDKNVFAKVACGVVLAVIVTAAGVGLLVQHRKLDELRKARVDLEKANWQLSVGREELVSANGMLAEELRTLREVGRTHATDQAAAREAQSRAEAEVARLKATVKDMSAVVKKLRAEREKLRKERDLLEHELNDAMEPAADADNTQYPVPLLAEEADEAAVPVPPAPDLDKRTPEERAAHEKKELNDLIGL